MLNRKRQSSFSGLTDTGESLMENVQLTQLL